MINFKGIEDKIVGYTLREDELADLDYCVPLKFGEFIKKYSKEGDDIYQLYGRMNNALDVPPFKDGKLNGNYKFSRKELADLFLEREALTEAMKLIVENRLL